MDTRVMTARGIARYLLAPNVDPRRNVG